MSALLQRSSTVLQCTSCLGSREPPGKLWTCRNSRYSRRSRALATLAFKTELELNAKADSAPAAPADFASKASIPAGQRRKKLKNQQKSLAKKAKSLADAGKRDAALQLLQEALQQWPHNGHLALAAANIEAKQGNSAAARHHYAVATASEANGTIPMQAWAGFEVKQKEYGKAQELFDLALSTEQAAGNVDRQTSLLKASGDALVLQGRAVQAADVYEQALALQPGVFDITLALARVKDRSKQIQEARTWYQRAITLNPTSPLSYQGLGHMEAGLGRYQQAQRAFQEGSHKCPPHAPLLNAWAGMEANRCNISRARALYEQALQADPQHLQTLLALGSLEGRAGNVEKGRGHLMQGLRQQPQHKHFKHALAQLHRNHGNKEAAREQLQDLLKGNPHTGHAWHTLGEMAEEAGDTAEAARCFQEGIKCPDADALLSYEGLAAVEAFWGNTDRARGLFQEGHLKHKGTSRFYRAWAQLEKKADQLQRASELFAQAAEAGPTDARTWFNWALLERRRSNPDAARRCFSTAVALTPRNPFAYMCWAMLEADAGAHDEAQAIFQQGHSVCPKTPALTMEYAVFQATMGRTQHARQLFQEGFFMEPLHPPLLTAWAAFETSQEQWDEAKRILAVADAGNLQEMARQLQPKAAPSGVQEVSLL